MLDMVPYYITKTRAALHYFNHSNVSSLLLGFCWMIVRMVALELVWMLASDQDGSMRMAA